MTAEDIAREYAYEIEERIAIRVEAGQPDDQITRLLATREVLDRCRQPPKSDLALKQATPTK